MKTETKLVYSVEGDPEPLFYVDEPRSIPSQGDMVRYVGREYFVSRRYFDYQEKFRQMSGLSYMEETVQVFLNPMIEKTGLDPF